MAKDQFLGAVAAIQDAALQPEGWPLALSRVGKLIGSGWLVMAALPLKTGSGLVVQDQDGDAEHLALFRQKYNTPETNPAIPSLMASGHGTIVLREQDMTDEEWHRCGLYREIYKPVGAYHGLGAFVLKTGSHVGFLGCNRIKARGRFTSADIGSVRRTMPHLERALEVFLRLSCLQSQTVAHQVLWDKLPFGVVLLDRCGGVLWTNQEASVILSRADGLSIRHKFLSAASPAENADLQGFIRAAIATSEGDGAVTTASLCVSRPSLRRSLTLLIAPIRIEHAFVHQPVAVIFITDPEREPEAVPEMLKRLYGLTTREAEVAGLLMQGIELREAAGQLEVSMHTVRTHLRLIFEKTDTHRQSELVHILLRGPAGLI
jgi:DNA-binding CsgD family transcriptional regulator